MDNLRKGLGIHIQKSYTEGIYTDNSQNRKLGRVGMSYGQKLNLSGFEEEPDNEDTYTSKPKLVLKRAKQLLTDRQFQLVKDIMESDSFSEGDIYEYGGKICFNTITEVNPERDKDIINLGKREESTPGEEQKYYKFIRETWSPQQLENKWLTTFKKEESWGKAKYYSKLAFLKMEKEQRDWLIEEAKRDLWWKLYEEGKVTDDSDYNSISNEEAERYIKIHGKKIDKDNLFYNSKHKSFIESLEKYGIDFSMDKNKIDGQKEKFKKYFIDCPKNEFYQAVKGCSDDPSYIDDLIRLRFAFKYNKMIAGQGWDDLLEFDKKGHVKINITKRDEIIELCKQIEYAVDDVLGDDKNLFINNPNIDFIRYDKNTKWGGASYNKSEKTITITSEYFQAMKESRKNSKLAGTLSREKFMVEGFIHEIGHSLDTTKDIYDSFEYKDFAEHLGYGDKNRLYTIYTNAIRGGGEFINQDYYLSIEKDKKDELIKKFKPLYDAYYSNIGTFNNNELEKIFISGYSSKSAIEGFAEYFSFYMGNKKFIDKEIEAYKKNPKEYLSKANIKSWYKYSVYGGRWEEMFNSIPERYRDLEGTKKLRIYYEAIIKHNIEMFEDIQKIVQKVKKKMS